MSVMCGIHKVHHPSPSDVRACYARRNAGRNAGREMAAASVDRFDRYGSLLAERAEATIDMSYSNALSTAVEVWCPVAQERAAAPNGFCQFCGSTKHAPTAIDPVFAASSAGRSKIREVAKRQGERLVSFQAAVKPARTPVASDGVFRLGDDFYQVKVAVHGSGRLYANRFNTSTQNWDYVGSPNRAGLAEEDRLTREDAAKFGKLYGQCISCHRVLTLQESIDRGMGATCAGKEGYFAA